MIPTSFSSNIIMSNDDDVSSSVTTFIKASRDTLMQTLSQQQQQQQAHTSSSSTSILPHFVLGNPAGDADSIISAIGLAYVDTLFQQQQQQQQQQQLQITDDNNNNININNNNNNNNNTTISSPLLVVVPIVSIPISDLKTQRPETTYLLKDCAGMTDHDLDSLIGIDDLRTLDFFFTQNVTVTLVDHNRHHHHHHHHHSNNKNNKSETDTDTVGSGWHVTEIVDHHRDDGYHSDTCIVRNIAFDGSQPLVASTCTLIVERFYQHQQHQQQQQQQILIQQPLQWPPTLSILLLGVILLDSVNMLPGKGTPRDGVALERLLNDTDWTQSTLPKDITDSTGKPDPTKLFQTLQDQKFSKSFWNGLTAIQGIRMDYKKFPLLELPSSESSNEYLGIATILQDMDTFWNKDNVIQSMVQVIQEDNLQVLALMHTFLQNGGDGGGDGDGNVTAVTKETNGKPCRQLVLTSLDKDRLQKLVQYLTKTNVSVVDDDDDDDSKNNLDDNSTDDDLELTTVTSGQEHVVLEEELVSCSDLPAAAAAAVVVYYVKMNQGNVKASRKQVAPILTSFWE
ncbi:DHHA2 domain containing protein [Nitzschia inconspicua]|uniref:DHHA2 domain containing protein n=1 Tax=Nitzschia inconspicua TaxID=303405 RepID=A0A9K3PYB4_9STRA|nr:DHHA2 domain containing protein [Nitzschia inconspicua]